MPSKLKALVKVRPLWLLVVAVITTALLGYLSGLLTPIQPEYRSPLLDINDGILLGVLGGLGIFVGHLYARLGKVEDKVEAMSAAKDAALDKLTAAASFINRVGLWMVGGQKGPMPQPPDQILPHIDAELWETTAESQPWAE